MKQLGMQSRVLGTFDEVLERTIDALGKEGFGVLTRIDVQDTLRKKLGVQFRRYLILGACNPALAHRALSDDLSVGLLLPCNVVVHELDDGTVQIGVVDPMQILDTHDGSSLREVASEARERLERVVASLKD